MWSVYNRIDEILRQEYTNYKGDGLMLCSLCCENLVEITEQICDNCKPNSI